MNGEIMGAAARSSPATVRPFSEPSPSRNAQRSLSGGTPAARSADRRRADKLSPIVTDKPDDSDERLWLERAEPQRARARRSLGALGDELDFLGLAQSTELKRLIDVCQAGYYIDAEQTAFWQQLASFWRDDEPVALLVEGWQDTGCLVLRSATLRDHFSALSTLIGPQIIVLDSDGSRMASFETDATGSWLTVWDLRTMH